MKKVAFEIELPVSVFKDGASYVAYTPALDLSTSAKTYDGVKKRFEKVVPVFIEELARKGTLSEYLENFGWKKVQKKWTPPAIVSQGLEKITVPHLV